MPFSTIVIIIPILSFSVVSIAIIIERFLFLKKNKINIDKYKSFLPSNFIELKNYCLKNNKNIFNNMLISFFSSFFSSKVEMDEYLDSSFTSIYLNMQKRVNYLGIFAKLSTLLGLFGTVIGMIMAFNNIVAKGISNAGIVASGISTALITTAVGLAVAIPSTFFHDFFQSKIETEIKKMEIVVSDIIAAYAKKRKEVVKS